MTLTLPPRPRLFLDTSVFVYAIGTSHPLKAPSVALIKALADGMIIGESSTLVVQELVHQRTRRTLDRRGAADRGREIYAMTTVHDVGGDDGRHALALFERHEGLDMADALHAAVAMAHRTDALISADRGFAAIADLTWLEPEAAVEVVGL